MRGEAGEQVGARQVRYCSMPGSRSRSALSPTARAHEQALGRIDVDSLRSYSTQAQYEDMQASLERVRERLAGGAVWHVNAHVVGGVAETLHAVLGLMRDGGINARWALLEAGDDFFELTQRLYEDLSGVAHEFGSADRTLYEGVLASVAAEFSELVVDGDVVVLYDPPAAGLAPALSERGASVIWRCHVGTDAPDLHGTSAQEFLRPYLDRVRTCLFARASFAWPWLGSERTSAVHSSINPISAKNQELEPDAVTAILAVVGLIDAGDGAAPVFTRLDGSPWRVNRPAAIDQEAPLPDSAPLIAHVSSWDRLKDPLGLIECFARHCDTAAHLVIAGPDPTDQVDTPLAIAVRSEVRDALGLLAPDVRGRVHVVSLPTEDLEENAAAVNAIQRRADVFVRKSLSEGFGLAIAESMWKRTPVVASRIGGIGDLVAEGESGILVDDPNDLAAFGAAIGRLVADPELAARLGDGGRQTVQERFLTTSHLPRYLDLIAPG
jgi:trehalose synthase